MQQNRQPLAVPKLLVVRVVLIPCRAGSAQDLLAVVPATLIGQPFTSSQGFGYGWQVSNLVILDNGGFAIAYGVEFGMDQYEQMATVLGSLKGKAIVSLNDHPDIRRVFSGFQIESTDIRYTVGGGQGVERTEVLIFSWDTKAEPAGLF